MFITDQSSKYTNITAPALYTQNDSLTYLSHTHTNTYKHICTYAHTHTHTHTKDTRDRVQYNTGMFNGTVPFNLLSIHLQLVKIMYFRPEYEDQSYITCLSV
jgi:hypothetical protein